MAYDGDKNISRMFYITLNCMKLSPCLQSSLLFISCKFVKGFLAITFYTRYFQLKLSWCVSTFFIRPETKFQLDSTKDKEFPHRPPIIKIAHFCNVMSIDMTLQKGAIFIMGVYGEISHFLSDQAEISYLVI